MKHLRDVLIVLVLGGIVIWFAAHFLSRVHNSYVGMDMTVVKADFACIEDGVICHAGYDSFQSVADAEAYLKSDVHLAAAKKREQETEQRKREDAVAQCLTKAKTKIQKQECKKLTSPPPKMLQPAAS